MKRSLFLFSLLVASLLFLSGCTQAGNPLIQAEATPLPGVDQELHAASASNSNASELTVTLYYRYLDYSMLAGESRTLTVKRDESPEMAVLQALLEGPSAEKIELRRLFGEDVSLRSVSSSNDILFVTLNAAFLNDDVPSNWQTLEDWATEAPVYRLLTVQSLVNTITENFAYSGVQIMVSREDGSTADSRLERGYFLGGGTGPTDPLERNESLILTAHNTALMMLTAWQERDFDTLYAFTSSYVDFETKPIYENFLLRMDEAPSLAQFDLSHGSVSENGQYATLTLSLTLQRDSSAIEAPAFPLQLVRENGIWKATYTTLQQMMLR